VAADNGEVKQQMAIFELPVLGPTEFKPSPYGHWAVELPLGAESVSVDFFVDGQEMTAALLSRVEKFVENIEHFDRLARAAIRADYASGEDANSRRYLSDHLENFSPAERFQCFGTDDVSSIGVEHLLAGLGVLQVMLYPEAQDAQPVAHFDYILGSAITDQILCIGFNASGEAGAVGWDS
jgi:hypothetical protein